jgi:LysR family transcriptional activator of nhaA
MGFSYRHLHYFWVVAREGGVARGAARLGVAVQTVSAQVRELERELGHALLKPAGRRLVLTEAGEVAARHADQIFALGEQLPELLRHAGGAPRVRLAVGISDGIAKLVANRLLAPVVRDAHVRLLCHEDELDDLLADLALHRLDVVLADQAPAPNANLRLFTHRLGTCKVAWYGYGALSTTARRGFPQSLARVPVLLPTAHAAVREQIDRWLRREGVEPNVVGEFEDSALLATFGARGMGVFPAPVWLDGELTSRLGLKSVGTCPGVVEEFFAICAERKIGHPLVQRLLDRRVR